MQIRRFIIADYHIYNMRHLLLTLFAFLSLQAFAQNKEYHGNGIEDYLRYAPYASVFALKAFGVESRSSWKRIAVDNAIGIAFTTGVTYSLKRAVRIERPDGTDNHSFPSGHTSLAFAGATALHKEYGHLSSWISIAGYSVATFTAIERVRRNRHNWGDVVIGAGIGTFSTLAGYWIGDLITGDKDKYTVGISPEGVQLIVNL